MTDAGSIPLQAQVLIVDDEGEHAEAMADALRRPGHICTVVHSRDAARDELTFGNFDVVVTDLVMETPDAGLEVLRLAREHQPSAAAILVTAHGDIATAKAALKGGAWDFIEKPLDLEVFRSLVQRAAETVALRSANADLRDKVDAAFGLGGIIGVSPAIRAVTDAIRRVAPSMLPVLVTGESGTGKELVARAIHQFSRRAEKRFVPFNAAGMTESLVEDQLFGHMRGAYTGADRDREGVFEYADRGTLFIDEIGDMQLGMQPKILRALEKGEIIRLGANEPRKVDVRFVSATNRDLKAMGKAGHFREDLYFRLRGTEIHIPPLRERREDIPVLIRHAASRFAQELGRAVPAFTDGAMMRLLSYAWPGNVRELLNTVHQMLVMVPGDSMEVTDVPDEIRGAESDDLAHHPVRGSLAGIGIEQLEREAIRQTLALTQGNREKTAQLLGMGERTLYRKLKDYGMR
ncbi:MAG: sigma-54 dependent transcriptional regulator [Planctomycetota bacterium]|nr:sigma-54 dependent transcriptional regulator [Planctomycetota bacterium]MDA1105769.1 sigma-54 dependent transcriptional regulator [Planctomycetota bacterium]